MLSNLRALDLTDDKGFVCGKILGDLGADIIKIERPGGDPARNIGPFYHDTPDPEKSLHWFFFNGSKRGITLNLEMVEGQQIFRRLVRTADFVIESFPPDYMDKLGLGYTAISEINPRVIMTSITPFGQTGPYKDYKTSDIVAIANAGPMAICGDPDRPPLRLNPYHAYGYAGANAAVGTMIAWYYREVSGQGQHVDVSVQQSVALENFVYPPLWELEKWLPKRAGQSIGRSGGWYSRLFYPCRDGWAVFVLLGGPPGAGCNRALTKWMEEEGIAHRWKDLNERDWATFDPDNSPQEELAAIEEELASFIAKHTKKELEEGFLKRGTRVSPVCNIKEVFEHPQLAFRGSWQKVEYPGLSDPIISIGQFFLSSETESKVKCPAPRIGQHNEEFYKGELGLPKEKIIALRQSGVI